MVNLLTCGGNVGKIPAHRALAARLKGGQHYGLPPQSLHLHLLNAVIMKRDTFRFRGFSLPRTSALAEARQAGGIIEGTRRAIDYIDRDPHRCPPSDTPLWLP